MKLFKLMLVFFVPTAAVAGDGVAERVLAAYTVLDSYCDTVAVQDQQLDQSELRRCYTRDGRYKRSEQFKRPPHFNNVQWGNDEYAYRWHKRGDSTTHYAEKPARSWRAGGPPDGLAARALGVFLRSAQTNDHIRNMLRGMDIVENGAESIVLERRHTSPFGTVVVNRIWVRQIDNFIVRATETWDGKVARSATLIEARANLQLSHEDLTEDAPFLQRYSLNTRPGIFIFLLIAASFVAGLLLSFTWRRNRNWRRIWFNYAKLIGVTIGCLVVLALLSLGVDGGHPPAIIVPMILGAFTALAGIASASFLAAMLLGDHWLTYRFRSGSRN